jgi:hypothetical protein
MLLVLLAYSIGRLVIIPQEYHIEDYFEHDIGRIGGGSPLVVTEGGVEEAQVQLVDEVVQSRFEGTWNELFIEINGKVKAIGEDIKTVENYNVMIPGQVNWIYGVVVPVSWETNPQAWIDVANNGINWNSKEQAGTDTPAHRSVPESDICTLDDWNSSGSNGVSTHAGLEAACSTVPWQ